MSGGAGAGSAGGLQMSMWDLSTVRLPAPGREAENWLSALGGVWGKREGETCGVDGGERRREVEGGCEGE